MKKLIVIPVLFFVVFSTSAQIKKWTLKECVEYALQNNISIKQSALDIEVAQADKLTAIGTFLPSLNGSTSVSENTGLSFNPVTNSPQTTTLLSATGRINVGYNLFDGLRNIRQLQRAKLSELASQYRLDKMKDDISLFVANSYLTVLTNKANLKSLLVQNEVTNKQIKRTNELVEAGVLPKGDLLEIQAANADELRNIANTENQIEISLISLAQLLLIKEYKSFDIQDEGYNIINEEISQKSVSEIIESAKENRFEIKIAEQNLAIAQKDLQISKGAYYPTLSAFFGYDTRYTNASGFQSITDLNNPVVTQNIGVVEGTGQNVIAQFPNTIAVEVSPDPFIDQLYQNDGIGYGLSLNVPIFNGFATRSAVKRSKVNVLRQEYLLEQATLDLESSIYQAYEDVKGSLTSYEAAKSALASQELAYQYAKDRYDVGRTNAFDFSQSKQRYDNAKITANIAKYDYIFKLKVLELFFGVSVADLKF